MPLNLTKIAFGCPSLAVLEQRLAARGVEARLTTRYRPKRATEIAGGSLYWIIAHRIVARSPILRFDDAPDGRTDIVIAGQAIPVMARPRRAHQGWRYLDPADAPPDASDGDAGALPPELRDELSALGLV